MLRQKKEAHSQPPKKCEQKDTKDTKNSRTGNPQFDLVENAVARN
jgi:hypothetical protein